MHSYDSQQCTICERITETTCEICGNYICFHCCYTFCNFEELNIKLCLECFCKKED